MVERPAIKLGDWINIGSLDCVVSRVRVSGDRFGDCEVVFNAEKPTNRDAMWSGAEWTFVPRGDFGGYADKYSRLRTFVEQLKRGRHHPT